MGEIEKLAAALAERLDQETRLTEELASKSAALNRMRAVALIEEVNSDQVANLEAEVVGLQGESGELWGVIAGLEAVLTEKRHALEPALLEDAEGAVDKNAKALARTCKVFVETLEDGATAMQDAGLTRHHQKWQELIEERQQLLYDLYELVGGSEDRADRRMRSELINDYGLFSPDVAEAILDLARCLVDLYETRGGRPAVRGRH